MMYKLQSSNKKDEIGAAHIILDLEYLAQEIPIRGTNLSRSSISFINAITKTNDIIDFIIRSLLRARKCLNTILNADPSVIDKDNDVFKHICEHLSENEQTSFTNSVTSLQIIPKFIPEQMAMCVWNHNNITSTELGIVMLQTGDIIPFRSLTEHLSGRIKAIIKELYGYFDETGYDIRMIDKNIEILKKRNEANLI